jgi:hypothetical protein
MDTSILHHSSCSRQLSTQLYHCIHQCLTLLNRLLLPIDQLQSGPKLTSELISTLSRCPSDIYVLINQPGVGVSDFSTPTSAPTLSKFLNRAAHPILRSSIIIPEVAGSVDVQLLGRELDSKCGAWSTAIDAAGNQIMSTFTEFRSRCCSDRLDYTARQNLSGAEH